MKLIKFCQCRLLSCSQKSSVKILQKGYSFSRAQQTAHTERRSGIHCNMATGNDNKQNINILAGVTGSVASIKLPILVEKLLEIPKVCFKLFIFMIC
jgi:hypothetical protein